MDLLLTRRGTRQPKAQPTWTYFLAQFPGDERCNPMVASPISTDQWNQPLEGWKRDKSVLQSVTGNQKQEQQLPAACLDAVATRTCDGFGWKVTGALQGPPVLSLMFLANCSDRVIMVKTPDQT